MARGWKPRGGTEGGEAGEAGIARTFEEEGDQMGDGFRSRDEETMTHVESEGGGNLGDVDEVGMRNLGSGVAESGSAAYAAAALAGGSGGASAAGPQGPRLEDDSGPPARAPELWPELPESEARAVISELRAQRWQRHGILDEGPKHKKARKVEAENDEEGLGYVGSMQLRAQTGRPGQEKRQFAADQQRQGGDAHDDDEPARRRQRLAEDDPGELARPGRAAPPLADYGTLVSAARDPFPELPEAAAKEVMASAIRRGGYARKRAGQPFHHGAKRSRGLHGGERQERREEEPGRDDRRDDGRQVLQKVGTTFGRRYTGVVSDPVDTMDGQGHVLLITGPFIWCQRCGRYAKNRLRPSLKNACVGAITGACVTRLARLQRGQHPLTGEPIVDG